MKSYRVYRNIRKRALIYGLPLGFFALMMLSVLGSLLGIIFSFSLILVVLVILWNLSLYLFLLRLVLNPHLLHYQRVFPAMIAHKKMSGLNYED